MEKSEILIIDSNLETRKIFENIATSMNCNYISVNSIESGLDILEKKYETLVSIIIEWKSYDIRNFEILKEIKSNTFYKEIPVIIKTSITQTNIHVEVLKAGAYFLISDLYNYVLITSIMKSAVSDFQTQKKLDAKLRKDRKFYTDFLCSGKIKFQTFNDVRNIVKWLNEYICEKIYISSVYELMMNAIEHGNLGITYEEKSELLKSDLYDEEIEKRLELYKDKFAFLNFNIENNLMNIKIEDKGIGFDYKKYLNIDPSKLCDSHGRGIFMANTIVEDGITYHENGKIVELNLKMN